MGQFDSVLKMISVAFEKIEFMRINEIPCFDSDKELKWKLKPMYDKRDGAEIYKVVLDLIGEKESEYSFEIIIAGYFMIDSENELKEDMKKALIYKNTVAILLPYLRSELSMLTSQPGMRSEMLPIIDVNKLFI